MVFLVGGLICPRIVLFGVQRDLIAFALHVAEEMVHYFPLAPH